MSTRPSMTSLKFIGNTNRCFKSHSVCRLAWKWLFHEYTVPKNTPLHIYPFQVRRRPNPYYLPWFLKQLVSDARITNAPELHVQLEWRDLIQNQFPKWRPSLRQFRDLKYRMAPLGSCSRTHSPSGQSRL